MTIRQHAAKPPTAPVGGFVVWGPGSTGFTGFTGFIGFTGFTFWPGPNPRSGVSRAALELTSESPSRELDNERGNVLDSHPGVDRSAVRRADGRRDLRRLAALIPPVAGVVAVLLTDLIWSLTR